MLVTEKFASGQQEIPPTLVALVRSQKQQQQQLRGLATVNDSRDAFTDGALAEMQGNNGAALNFYLKSVDALERDRRSLWDGAVAEICRGPNRFLLCGSAAVAGPSQVRGRVRDDGALSFESTGRHDRQPHGSALARPEEQRLYGESAQIRSQIADSQARLFDMASEADASKNAPRLAALNTQIRTLEDQYRQVASRIAVEAPVCRVSSTPNLPA